MGVEKILIVGIVGCCRCGDSVIFVLFVGI